MDMVLTSAERVFGKIVGEPVNTSDLRLVVNAEIGAFEIIPGTHHYHRSLPYTV